MKMLQMAQPQEYPWSESWIERELDTALHNAGKNRSIRGDEDASESRRVSVSTKKISFAEQPQPAVQLKSSAQKTTNSNEINVSYEGKSVNISHSVLRESSRKQTVSLMNRKATSEAQTLHSTLNNIFCDLENHVRDFLLFRFEMDKNDFKMPTTTAGRDHAAHNSRSACSPLSKSSRETICAPVPFPKEYHSS